MKTNALLMLLSLMAVACQSNKKPAGTELASVVSSPAEDATSTNRNANDYAQKIEGGWNLIWASYNGKIRNTGRTMQFMLFAYPYFSYLNEDENGKWQVASTGTYELRGKLYKARFIHSSVPQYVGAYAEWTYEFRGDSLIMEGPTKVLDAQGKEAPELADGLNRWKEIRVRARP